MINHKKVYLSHFNFDEGDFVPCEICGAEAVDIHHIDCRGMGGSKNKDNIENLMALCRKDHLFFGDKKQFKDYLTAIHQLYIENFVDKYEKVGK